VFGWKLEKLAGSCFLKTAALFAKLQHFARMRSPTNHVTLRAADAYNKRQLNNGLVP
jgi:hypothetical protein